MEFHHDRNNYDKVGFSIQGFVPAMITLEILIRKKRLNKSGLMFFICVCVCIATSVFYKLITAFVTIASAESANAFLET